ncbi:octapeptide-repeat protein T2-like [Haliotis rubra]|uniref:octapeptide-repeat protein T2-like n=1 Tax=Haliotis rubra TaxID=36100 RepID=UPI001EE5DEF9|nr:octapeptide-repeat protein T2-like [Haliotis rubra]
MPAVLESEGKTGSDRSRLNLISGSNHDKGEGGREGKRGRERRGKGCVRRGREGGREGRGREVEGEGRAKGREKVGERGAREEGEGERQGREGENWERQQERAGGEKGKRERGREGGEGERVERGEMDPATGWESPGPTDGSRQRRATPTLMHGQHTRMRNDRKEKERIHGDMDLKPEGHSTEATD